jgi:hypothetical protein
LRREEPTVGQSEPITVWAAFLKPLELQRDLFRPNPCPQNCRTIDAKTRSQIDPKRAEIASNVRWATLQCVPPNVYALKTFRTAKCGREKAISESEISQRTREGTVGAGPKDGPDHRGYRGVGGRSGPCLSGERLSVVPLPTPPTNSPLVYRDTTLVRPTGFFALECPLRSICHVVIRGSGEAPSLLLDAWVFALLHVPAPNRERSGALPMNMAG